VNRIKYLIILFFVCSASVADACSVCNSDYSEAEVKAYSVITALLAMMPILGMLGLGFWLYRRYRIPSSPTE